MKRRKCLYCLCGVVLLVFSFIFYLNLMGGEREELVTASDFLAAQSTLEQSYMSDLEQNKYTPDNPKVILNPYGNSPLTAIVMFITEAEEAAEVTVAGKDEKTTVSHTFPAAGKHILPVYGLYAGSENKVTIKAGAVETTVEIKTEPLPREVIMPNRVDADREAVGGELIFVSTVESMLGKPAAYDINGDVRWYLEGNYSWGLKRLANGHLMVGAETLLKQPYHKVGLVEIDLSGKIYCEYILPGGFHHDFFEMENGNILVASNVIGRGTVEDYIVLLNREKGEIEKAWDLREVLPTEEGKSENWVQDDWFHNNSVWYDKGTNSITLSGRHQDAVINIDYDSGELNWIIGDCTSWSKDMEKYFFKPVGNDFEWQWSQHSALVLPDGKVFLFDNGNNRSKYKEQYLAADNNYSRGVIYQIDTTAMTIAQIWQYGKERGSDFYSPYISNVDYLGENHYLVHSGGIGKAYGFALNQPSTFMRGAVMTSITSEILNDEVILELELPGNYYRAKKYGLYTDNNLVFGRGKRLGTLAETPSEEKTGFSLKATSLPREYNLAFSKETERLAISGIFPKGIKVNLILQKFLKQKIYHLAEVTEQTNIYYINRTGLTGRYDIYLEIDGEVYDTGKYVIFGE